MISYSTTQVLSLQQMRSVWELINRMSVLSFIIICRRVWKTIIGEAGRAGRDGLDAKCILLFSPQDIVINRFLLDHKEMQDLDPADRETVRERDVRRLQVMERYCYTTECLRNYILKYFGKIRKKPCQDCGNCLREFETLDMTEADQKVINCVYEAKGRYGRQIIIDTVAGAKTARLEEIGLFATSHTAFWQERTRIC